ncbi:MAG: SH3 domain-containing protein [Eubacteriales bacterium]|nr:SH3 domain-containing protein [Eubacteriales bacterium]
MKDIRDLLLKYKAYTAAAVAVLIVLVVVLARGCSGDASGGNAGGGASAEAQAAGDEAQAETEETNELEENSHASVERLVTKYLDCMMSGDVDTLATIVDQLSDEDRQRVISRATAYDSYSNMTCYTKDGPQEDSYIVFLCYDIKMKDSLNISTLVPDIQCLYVTAKDEEGDRYIRYSSVDEDEELEAYVAELEEDPEVKALYEDVKARYQEALESDDKLADIVQRVWELGQSSGEEETASEEEPAAEETESAEAPAEEETDGSEETTETGEATAQNRETRVTESVNVRAEASTDSERVALAYPGDAITQIESYDNGWSKVEYKGQTGYVMTEYLE